MTPERTTDSVHGVLLTPLLTVREAAGLLRISERTTWTLIQRGALPVIRLGRSVRIDPADLAAALERAKGGKT